MHLCVCVYVCGRGVVAVVRGVSMRRWRRIFEFKDFEVQGF